MVLYIPVIILTLWFFDYFFPRMAQNCCKAELYFLSIKLAPQPFFCTENETRNTEYETMSRAWQDIFLKPDHTLLVKRTNP